MFSRFSDWTKATALQVARDETELGPCGPVLLQCGCAAQPTRDTATFKFTFHPDCIGSESFVAGSGKSSFWMKDEKVTMKNSGSALL